MTTASEILARLHSSEKEIKPIAACISAMLTTGTGLLKVEIREISARRARKLRKLGHTPWKGRGGMYYWLRYSHGKSPWRNP